MNTFDEIIQTKAYSDLTPEELEVIRELVSSEQEYNEMMALKNSEKEEQNAAQHLSTGQAHETQKLP